MKKAIWVTLAILTLNGCTAAQEKARIYRDAAERFAVPDKVKLCYGRNGEIQTGAEYRCFGEGCKLPACEEDG